ncbi:alpha-2-macroglobulin family protein [Thalassotalea sp. PS06]|uniref:alpha-2-macroglobulin family protein n=1 Tax=Thalassotalea sp. PS06 TaxID=2594005 RepID=UPI001164B2F0|nr:MG2 domain-containing protein [Thalassotalea sp. PS06]QDP01629.1 hypothetical protein FNC98_09950 [Thalassotalea sp. PS06]
MRILIQSLILLTLTLLSSKVFAVQVDYIGHYLHKDKPALIIQFSESVASIDRPFQIKVFHIEGKEQETEISQHNQLLKNKLSVINSQVKVGSRYRVEVFDVGATTPFETKSVTIPEVSADVTVLGRGPVIPANGPRTIPLSVVNLETVAVEVMKVTEPASFMQKIFYSRNISSYQIQRVSKYLKTVTTLDYQLPKLPINKSQPLDIKLPDSLTPGWYLLAVKGGGQFDYDSTEFIQVLLTDIGVQAKVFDQQLAVHATHYSEKSFTQNAEVYVYQPKSGKTRLGSLKNGFGQFAYKVQGNEILLIEAADNTGWLPLKEMPLDLSDFDVTGNQYQDLQAFLYSNRDLFKPGESLPLNILLRDQDGTLAEQHQLYVEFVQPDGKVIANRWLDAANGGYFRMEYGIPVSAALGKWHARVKVNSGSKNAIAQLPFVVSEFVPERMDLIVDTGDISLKAQPAVKIDYQGRYLFGAPTSGNKLKISPYYQSLHHLKGPYQDYYVGTPFTVYPSRDLPKFKDIKLDEEGKASIDYPLLATDKLQSPVTVNLANELFEQGGATITRRQKFTYWKNEALTAIKGPAEINAHQQIAFDIAVLSTDGQKLLSGDIEYRLERNRGGYYWTYEESSGWRMHRDNEWRPVSMDKVSVKKGASKTIYLPVEYGNYRLVTWQSGGTKTTYAFNARWQGAGQQKPAKPDQLGLRLDKTDYQAGETIALQLQTPVAGKLLLTLESDQVEWHMQQQVAAGEVTLNVPLAEDIKRHDLYITATLVAHNNNESSSPRRLFAIAPVLLERGDRQLNIQVKHDEVLLPLKKASLTIDTQGLSGDSAWVTVSLVDKGIINLSGFEAENPFDYFFNQKRYGGDVIDLYSRFYQQRPDSFIQHRYGGDAQAAFNKRPDQLVEAKSITLMTQAIPLDGNGSSEISVDIPDYNGEAQLVATVFSANSYGQQIQDVTIRAPIVAELAIPRFLTPGDESQAMLEVFNQTDTQQQISLSIVLPEQLQSSTDTSKSVTLDDGERTTLPLSFKVGSGIEFARIGIDIESDASSFSRSWTVPVRDGMPLLSKKHTLTLDAGDSITLQDEYWQGIDINGANPGMVAISSNALLDPMPYTEHLFSYPYGCAEQTTSKAMPWLIDNPDLEQHKQNKLQHSSEKELLEIAIARLSGMQKSTGGFSLWNKQGKEDAWISVYVTDFLLQAEQKYPNIVPKQMLNRATNRIKTLRYRQQQPAQYYAYWLLAQTNQIEYGNLRKLQERLAPGPLASAYLGAALMLKGDVQAGQRLILDSRETPRTNQYAYGYDYGSYLRDYARIAVVISQLSEHIKLSNELISLRNDLVEKVKKDLNRRRYLSTQEQIALVELGSMLNRDNQTSYQFDYASSKGQDAYEQGVPEHGTPEQGASRQGISRVSLVADSVLKNTNDFPLYVEILARGPASDKSDYQSTIPYSSMGKQYLRENGDSYEGEPLSVGEKLIVVIDVQSNEKIEQGLLVDFLPTGFVLENPMFTNANEVLRNAGIAANTLLHEEFRNDRYVAAVDIGYSINYKFAYVLRAETPSTSKARPTLIEDMYQPERLLFIEPPVKGFEIKP